MTNKLASFSKTILLGTVVFGLLFSAILVRAEQVFLFSDNLSTQFDIEQGQTSAKFSFGRFYTADNSVSSAVASKVIANPSRVITQARLDVSVSVPSSTRIIYYLSNNNGSRWTQVNPGFTYIFDSIGNKLRWRAVVVRDSPFIASAYIDNVNITYTVSDSLTPTPSTGSNSGTLSTVVYGAGGDLTSFVCDALGSIGLGCGAPKSVATPVFDQSSPQQPAQPASAPQNSPQEQPRQPLYKNDSLQASIANVTVERTASDDEVILVKVPATNGVKSTFGLSTNDAIFEIIRGQKHFIPTVDIFFDYGFDLNAVQSITHEDLEPFPRAKLVNVYKDSKKKYYITEGNMIRLIPNKRVFESYGDREEDMITISKKEFNFYPRNQYVFLENSSAKDVFQIVDGDTKRFVTPQMVKKIGIKSGQIAPVNQMQLDAYINGAPIIY